MLKSHPSHFLFKVFKIMKSYKKYFNYEVNRPLKENERRNHLLQDKPAPIPVAWPQFSIIQMNSTFLECVDLRFGRKGVASGFSCVVIGFLISILVDFTPSLIEVFSKDANIHFVHNLVIIFVYLIFLFLIVIFFLVFRLETFDFTHYPMRFNRKTRMVHVFLDWQNGKILSIPWKDIYFSFKDQSNMDFIILGHQLTEDRNIVLQTFALPSRDERNSVYRFLQWEFVRQYMEDDDRRVQELADMVYEVADVATRRESLYGSFRQAWGAFAGRYLYLAVLFSPFILLSTIGRQIAVHTSRIPRWPAEIEATCHYPPNDPCLRDGRHLARRGDAPWPDLTPYVGKLGKG